MPEDDHVTVKIPKDLTQEMDKLKGRYGFRSRGEIAKEAIRRLINYYEEKEPILPRFEQINCDIDGVKILDRQLRHVADVHFKPEGIFCKLCEKDACEHIDFALSQSDVQELVRKKHREGWKLPDI